MKELILGVFRRPRAARRAFEALRELGFFDNQLGVLSSEAPSASAPSSSGEQPRSLHADDLVALGLPEDEAGYYARELTHGYSVIVVEARGRTLHALTVLDRHGPFERAIFRVAAARQQPGDTATVAVG